MTAPLFGLRHDLAWFAVFNSIPTEERPTFNDIRDFSHILEKKTLVVTEEAQVFDRVGSPLTSFRQSDGVSDGWISGESALLKAIFVAASVNPNERESAIDKILKETLLHNETEKV